MEATISEPDTLQDDLRFMGAALTLARRGLGRVWPNPAVGCILLDAHGRVVGRGWTQPGGRPHAETEALARAGARARGGTAYVSLEPCAHHGKTGPCAEALVAAGLARVVIGADDPDPRVAGRGVAILRDGGIAVTRGVRREEAERLNAGFLKRITAERPLVTLKLATTLDARIATQSGESQWITGETARRWGHALRASHDAILAGASTVRIDNPALTCRLPGQEERSPIRVIMDGRLTTPLTAAVVATAGTRPTWILTVPGGDRQRKAAFRDCGLEVIEVRADDGGRPDADAALEMLARRGLTRVLVEGGAALSATLLRAGAVDRLAWFRAPDIIGGDGLPATQGFGITHLSDRCRFHRIRVLSCGRDQLELYEKQLDTI